MKNIYLKQLFIDNELSIYKCSKMSGIPYTTLLELINGKTDINKCSVDTINKLAKALNTTADSIIESCHYDDFEEFKSNIKHDIKEKGDFVFLIETYISNRISNLWNGGLKAKALYLLATTDYLSRINDLPIAENFEEMRSYSLEEELVPEDVRLLDELNDNEDILEKARKESIPEFLAFNIIETDLRNAA